MGATSTDDTPTDAHQAQPALASSSSQCQNCGAPLASDQRYCVACGERRGRARFSLPGATPAPAVATTTERPPRQPRISSGLVFISFVGTLLLAMGVGVLIGHTNNSQPVQRSSNPNINVNVAGGAGGGSGSGNTQASNNTSSAQKHAPAKAAAAPLPKKVVVKAQAAAANVLGGKNLPPATVTVGQKGSGPGYSNGKFDGNFFGSP